MNHCRNPAIILFWMGRLFSPWQKFVRYALGNGFPWAGCPNAWCAVLCFVKVVVKVRQTLNHDDFFNLRRSLQHVSFNQVGEQIRIGNDIVLTILEVQGSKVRVGVDAPDNIPIVRGELARNSTTEKLLADENPIAIRMTVTHHHN